MNIVSIYNTFLKYMMAVSDWLWGDPLLYLLGFGGIYITIRIGFVQFRYFGYACTLLMNDIFRKRDKEGTGTISAFQALSSALANSVGAGNIVGVPLAIFWGGPGAIFWMWALSVFGMGTKFVEVVLGIKYREKNEDGIFVGGPQYYLRKGLKKYKLQWLGVAFAIALMLEAVADVMVQSNAMVQSVYEAFKVPTIVTGITILTVSGFALFGGIKRIGDMSEKVVAAMALLFTATSLLIVILNITHIPNMIKLIFTHAFTPAAAVGGFAGASIASSMRWGCARGAYSNEAGDGTAPISHSAAITDHPVRQGLYGILEVFIDTIIICSCSAFVVLLSGEWMSKTAGNNPEVLTTIAFGKILGSAGSAIVAVSLSLFALTSIMVYSFYGEKQAEFLGGKRFAFFMRLVYLSCIFIGVFWDAKYLWPLMDIFFALMILPNMTGVVIMAHEAKELVNEFFNTPGKYYMADMRKDTGRNDNM